MILTDHKHVVNKDNVTYPKALQVELANVTEENVSISQVGNNYT